MIRAGSSGRAAQTRCRTAASRNNRGMIRTASGEETASPKIPRIALSDIADGQTAEFFAAIGSMEQRTASNGKPFYYLELNDRKRRIAARVWSNSPIYETCERQWKVGCHLLVHAKHDGKFGLTILTARLICKDDAIDGYDPRLLQSETRFDKEEMFGELLDVAKTIRDVPLRKVVMHLLMTNEAKFKVHPAASRNHHAYAGGLLEHTLSVVRTGAMLADKYAKYYEDLSPPLNKDLVVAGCILHDIGKLHELEKEGEEISYTKSGLLIGHIIVGRDMFRDAAREVGGLDPELQLMMEHVILSHQYLKEWDSPKEPAFPEALLVHFADDIDAKMNMYVTILDGAAPDADFSDANNIFRRKLLRKRKV
jgi:3'-5' exoribonuclease